MKFLGLAIIIACLCEVIICWDFISKNCCEPHDDERLGRICDDGSRAPLIGCCGVGACNVACCNCDGGCLSGNHKQNKLLGVWGADITPNLGLSGGSSAASGSKFVGELAKNTAAESGKGAFAVGQGAIKSNGDTGSISYHPSGK